MAIGSNLGYNIRLPANGKDRRHFRKIAHLETVPPLESESKR